MTTFLSFVALTVVVLLTLGRLVTPPREKKPWRSFKLDDYGATMRRGVVLLLDGGARARWRMEALHNQANYSEKGRNDGDRPPTDETEHPPEQIPPGAIPPHLRKPGDGPQYRPDSFPSPRPASDADDASDDGEGPTQPRR
ncbi:MAG TPA: hypothetical protein VJ976_00500 [Ornithinimicrobium sp.]|uniref:hypothetical protein n=1 Tax=Ornithinimicrobium sp. TaxID=1977084 RepID=UPI002B49B203|nr:hypothetical protein [Ornithinimicrobium sp.]HKJ10846.1 hypothetical protein [Ornithinimicrobium sp.]